MGRIFVGLCQVGAWGCFDEFNRLEERMLSAVSQQVQCIQEALREHSNPNLDKSEARLLAPVTLLWVRDARGFSVAPRPAVAGGAQDGTAPLAPWQLAGGWSFLCRQRPQAPPVSPQSQASRPECWNQTLVMCLGVPGS